VVEEKPQSHEPAKHERPKRHDTSVTDSESDLVSKGDTTTSAAGESPAGAELNGTTDQRPESPMDTDTKSESPESKEPNPKPQQEGHKEQPPEPKESEKDSESELSSPPSTNTNTSTADPDDTVVEVEMPAPAQEPTPQVIEADIKAPVEAATEGAAAEAVPGSSKEPSPMSRSSEAAEPATEIIKDILVPNIAGPGALANKILQIDGRITNPPNGNAWKEFRCYRNNQDMGSLWEVRQAWFLKQKK